MSKLTKASFIIITVGLIILTASFFTSAQETSLPSEITETVCDATIPCPTGLECISFPNIGNKCAKSNPCDYYKCPENTQCLVGETYPLQVICSSLKEPTTTDIETVGQSINLDETVAASDLGVKEPKLLPDSRFYFLKNWARGIRSTITFNPVKKTELKLKYSSEKLLETRKLAEKKKRPEILEKATEKYKKEIEQIKAAVDKIKETATTSPAVGKFLDKFTKQETLHLKILDKLEQQVPTSTAAKIREARERHLENFKDVMLKLEDKTKIGERLEKNLEELKGSEFKQFKNLEILKKVEEKVPEEVKETIKKARENTLQRLGEKLEQMSTSTREKFNDYVERIQGKAEDKMELLEDIKAKLKEKPQIKERLEGVQEKIMERLREGTKQDSGKKCQVSEITPLKCKGRVIVERDEDGCPLPKCVELGEEIIKDKLLPPLPQPSPPFKPGEETKPIPLKPGVACITLWDPVCGKDGKTYSNKCWAEAVGVAAAYKGVCKEPAPKPLPEPLLPLEKPVAPEPLKPAPSLIELKSIEYEIVLKEAPATESTESTESAESAPTTPGTPPPLEERAF